MKRYTKAGLKAIYKNISHLFDDREHFESVVNIDKKKLKLPELKTLNEKQKEVLKLARKPNVFLVVHGGIRSGKSYISLYVFLIRVIKSKKNSLFLATGYNLSALRNNIEQLLTDFGLEYGRDYQYNSLLYRYQIDGKVIRLCGANNKRSYSNIRGCTATGWYANEVILQDREVIYECIKRVSTHTRFKIWDTNPGNSEHYIYKDFILDASSKKIDTCHFTTYDNESNLPPDYISEQVSLLSKVDKQIYIDGEWLENSSMPFYKIFKVEYDYNSFIFGFQDRIAFLDPATGQGINSSKSALSIIFHEEDQDGTHNFYFFGFLYDGLWASHLETIAGILNKYNIETFYYEDNLIGKGVVERDFKFTELYQGNIQSIRNSTEKIARISSLIAPIEKKELQCVDWCDDDYFFNIKNANLEDKKGLDGIDSLESGYRVLTR